MAKSKDRASGSRNVDNDLDKLETDNRTNRGPSNPYQSGANDTSQKTNLKSSDTPKEDIIDRILRSLLSLITAVFSSAVVAGFLQVSAGWDISFASLPMLAITTVLLYPFYKLYTWLGFFRN